MEKITELTHPPKVGQVYLVPHATVVHRESDTIYKVPVIPNFHEDPEINSAIPKHYHIDLRFFKPTGDLEYIAWGNPMEKKWRSQRTNHVLCVEKTNHPYYQPSVYLKHENLKWIESICISIITGVDLSVIKTLAWDSPPVRWYRSYEGKKAVKGVCPHKGHNLSQCRAHKGVIECPLHGLQFKKDTMEVVKLEDRI